MPLFIYSICQLSGYALPTNCDDIITSFLFYVKNFFIFTVKKIILYISFLYLMAIISNWYIYPHFDVFVYIRMFFIAKNF